MSCQAWPEPIVRVQSLAESGLSSIPSRYIRPHSQRPSNTTSFPTPKPFQTDHHHGHDQKTSDHDHDHDHVNIPVIDLKHVFSEDPILREQVFGQVDQACREWGFFQVVNHGVSHELMKSSRELWREFFNQPLEMKEEYANSPTTYEGYGSRLGVQKGATLDWSDYFFLHYRPPSLRNQAKWLAFPQSFRYAYHMSD